MLAHQCEIGDAFVDLFDVDGEGANIARRFAEKMREAKEGLSGDLERIERLVVAPTGMS
jgi:hypothetical protein